MPKSGPGPEIVQGAIPSSGKIRRIDRDDGERPTVRAALKRLAPDAYTVGWICAIVKELVAAKEILDELHEKPQYSAAHDDNDYTLGRVGDHNVVVAILGEYGTTSAASVARDMRRSFPRTRFCLMVGIGGGAPSRRHDIRLGDIVVSMPQNEYGGVLQYDFGKRMQDHGFHMAGSLNQPPAVLQRAVNGLKAQYESTGNSLEEAINKVLENNPRLWKEYKRPEAYSDRLFKSTIVHPPDEEASCAVVCADEPCKLIRREERKIGEDNPAIHYGLIASGNQVMKDALVRDALAAERDVLCFEMEAAGLMNHLPCLVVRGICDYSDSHKNKEWQGYAAMAAAAYAKDLLYRIPPSEVETERKPSGGNNQSLSDKKKKELLDSLRFEQIDARQMNIKNAHAQTCKWLLITSAYVDWLDPLKLEKHSGFLWIKGKPGTGKSTLMKFALTNAHENLKDNIIISFFFNARGHDLEKSTVGMYQSLLLQLLEQHPRLQDDVFNSSRLIPQNFRQRQWGIEPLKELFEQALLNLGKSSVLCFIDALDECDENQIRDMISFFEHVGQRTSSADISFLVCFASRHYPFISLAKGLYLVLEGQEGHSEDIICYLDSKLSIGDSQLAKQIRTNIQKKASGVFLWVVLVVEILNKEHDRGRIYTLEEKLRQIPGNLYDLFHDMLTRDHQNRGELLLCIQWVLFARYPLQPDLLYFGILSGVEPGALSGFNRYDTTESVINRYIVDCSKGLAEVTKSDNPTVQFIHESVRDFLLKATGLKEIWSGLGGNFQGESHERLKQCCLNYLSNVYANLNLSFLPPKASYRARRLCYEVLREFPFAQYAIQNVLYHADAAEGSGVKQTKFLEEFQLVNWIKLDNLFKDYRIPWETLGASLLYILAENNLGNLIGAHPSNLCCFEVENEQYGLPIFAAFAHGSGEAVRAFIKAQAEIKPFTCPFQGLWKGYHQSKNKPPDFGLHFNFSRRRGILSYLTPHADEAIIVAFLLMSVEGDIDSNVNRRKPLVWAAKRGHEAVVRLLLEKGADTEAKDRQNERTPLLYAAKKGNRGIAELLLERGANIEARDKQNGRTPLLYAAENECDVTELLLENGADIEARDEQNGWTPLLCATANRREDIVRLLLEKGADIEARDEQNGWTPLLYAAANGYRDIIKLLLEKGADTEAKDRQNGWTPLLYAAKWNRGIAQLLLERGANIEARDKQNGRTPLLYAAENECDVTELLLENGADIEARDEQNGWTPLFYAAANGHRDIAKLLLEKGADIEAEDRQNGWTPLLYAAANGYRDIINLLLEKGADIEARDEHSRRIMLLYAAAGGYKDLSELLLERGADIEGRDEQNGWTPLLYATTNKREDIVRLLLEKGADIEASDEHNMATPLLYAAANGHRDIAKLLLERGADIEAKDRQNERTPLFYAAEKGNRGVAELLLEKGADIEAKDRQNERTPLFYAAEKGNRGVAELLLEKGADIEAKDSRNGWTPLLYAAANRQEDLVELLLEKGADIEAKGGGEHGLTPLLYAAENGHLGIVMLLLEKGADIEAKDEKNGRTPLLYAAENGHMNIVILLLKSQTGGIGGYRCRTLSRTGRRTCSSSCMRNGTDVQVEDM